MTATRNHLDDATVLLAGARPWLDRFESTLEGRTDAAVHSAASAEAALDRLDTHDVDCLLTERTLDDGTGLELLRAVRTVDRPIATVLATPDGSETLASDAIRAGADDYVPMPDTDEEALAALLERTDAAIDATRRATTRRDRAHQFEAVFRDTQTATWVLDADGTLARANRTARGMLDGDVDALVGTAFSELPWWTEPDGAHPDIRHLVAEARDGRFGTAVVLRPGPEDPDRVLELSVRPVENGNGDLVSIVVEGLDVTEQVTLERDLRRSEKLHRVTLNNMTDTVLITNPDGEYTYVCPNVHFIFGYTATEIREKGTIEDLLGPDLFDGAELAEKGVLKNIECTVTDKAGREHTLLVNVREVSIQDGTVLYSCRDITTRKQREAALATLQETARDFLYAETRPEIAQHVVDDVGSVLDLEASAVYLFDVDRNELRPAARSPSMAELHGPLPTVPTDEDTLPAYSFLRDETLVFDDVHDADRLANRATDLRSTIYIPLGNHGVFVAGSADVGRFDEITGELADLLAATAEAALDRVDRESQLRQQDRELQRRNDQLAALNRINATIREIDQAVVESETRAGIHHAVCERLTDNDRFEFAWIGAVDPVSDTIEPDAWAGDGGGYLDGLQVTADGTASEPAGRTAASGEVTTVDNVAANLHDERWRSEALARDFMSVLSIPIAYNDLTYGVLTVYANVRDAFDDTTRTVLSELAGTVGAALSAIERKRALLTSSTTRVEFSIDDSSFLLTRLARAADCTVSYQGGIQQTAEGNLVFVSVEDGAVERVAEAASTMAGIEEVNPIGGAEPDRGTLQLRLAEPFLALDLADHGAIFRAATADPSTAALVVDVPDSLDTRTLARLIRETFASVELERKRSLDAPAGRDPHSRFFEAVTDRQLEVVQTAFYGGFFESPREHTGEEIAGTLDISPPAFYQHVRTVQRKLFAALFGEGEHHPVTREG